MKKTTRKKVSYSKYGLYLARPPGREEMKMKIIKV